MTASNSSVVEAGKTLGSLRSKAISNSERNNWVMLPWAETAASA
jgi:hypothetical protein